MQNAKLGLPIEDSAPLMPHHFAFEEAKIKVLNNIHMMINMKKIMWSCSTTLVNGHKITMNNMLLTIVMLRVQVRNIDS